MPLNESELKTLLEVAEKAAEITPGPWSYSASFVRHVNATDRIGRNKSYSVCGVSSPGANELRKPNGDYGAFEEAKTAQRARGRHIAAFDPSTCAALVREVLRLLRLRRVDDELVEIHNCDKCDLCEDHHD